MTMRILLLDTGKEWGGGTNSMIELLKRLDRSRYAVTPLFFDCYPRGDGADLRGALADIGYPLEILPRLMQPWWAKGLKELVRGLLAWWPQAKRALVFRIELAWRIRPDARRIAGRLRAGGFDALYLNNQPSSNLEGLLAAEISGVPVVQHCRIEAELNHDEVAVLNRVVKRIICVSHGVAETLVAQCVDAARCTVVLNGVDGGQTLPDPTDVRRTGPLSDTSVVIGTIGSLVARKGVGAVLRALGLMNDTSIGALIVGDGPLRAELEGLATRLGLSQRTVFTGFQRAPLPYLSAMDIFCLASAREGLPRVILEAMLLGKPVVATDIPGCRELVRHGETGYLVPPDDVVALADALARLTADATLRSAMGRRGREIVLAEYSIESYVTGVTRVFDEVLA
jgi:glycosyltransferase involved in cell wall biosynthesis